MGGVIRALLRQAEESHRADEMVGMGFRLLAGRHVDIDLVGARRALAGDVLDIEEHPLGVVADRGEDASRLRRDGDPGAGPAVAQRDRSVARAGKLRRTGRARIPCVVAHWALLYAGENGSARPDGERIRYVLIFIAVRGRARHGRRLEGRRRAALVVDVEQEVAPGALGRIAGAGGAGAPDLPEPVDVAMVEPEERIQPGRVERPHIAADGDVDVVVRSRFAGADRARIVVESGLRAAEAGAGAGRGADELGALHAVEADVERGDAGIARGPAGAYRREERIGIAADGRLAEGGRDHLDVGAGAAAAVIPVGQGPVLRPAQLDDGGEAETLEVEQIAAMPGEEIP